MTDERSNDQDQRRKHNKHAVQTHTLHFLRNGSGNGMQQARGTDGFAQGKAACGEDDDGPEEVVKVFLSKDTSPEEEDDGDDGYDTHVSKDAFELVRHAPQEDGPYGDTTNEPLKTGKLVLHGSYGDDSSAFAGLKGKEEKYPDKKNRDNADWERDEEPGTPTGFGTHVLKCDDVLWGGDRRGCTSYVGSKSDAKDEGFGEFGVGREIAEHGL